MSVERIGGSPQNALSLSDHTACYAENGESTGPLLVDARRRVVRPDERDAAVICETGGLITRCSPARYAVTLET